MPGCPNRLRIVQLTGGSFPDSSGIVGAPSDKELAIRAPGNIIHVFRRDPARQLGIYSLIGLGTVFLSSLDHLLQPPVLLLGVLLRLSKCRCGGPVRLDP